MTTQLPHPLNGLPQQLLREKSLADASFLLVTDVVSNCTVNTSLLRGAATLVHVPNHLYSLRIRRTPPPLNHQLAIHRCKRARVIVHAFTRTNKVQEAN